MCIPSWLAGWLAGSGGHFGQLDILAVGNFRHGSDKEASRRSLNCFHSFLFFSFPFCPGLLGDERLRRRQGGLFRFVRI